MGKILLNTDEKNNRKIQQWAGVRGDFGRVAREVCGEMTDWSLGLTDEKAAGSGGQELRREGRANVKRFFGSEPERSPLQPAGREAASPRTAAKWKDSGPGGRWVLSCGSWEAICVYSTYNRKPTEHSEWGCGLQDDSGSCVSDRWWGGPRRHWG